MIIPSPPIEQMRGCHVVHVWVLTSRVTGSLVWTLADCGRGAALVLACRQIVTLPPPPKAVLIGNEKTAA